MLSYEVFLQIVRQATSRPKLMDHRLDADIGLCATNVFILVCVKSA